jgi:hypothetical protein
VLTLIAGTGQANFLHLNTLDYKKCDEPPEGRTLAGNLFRGLEKAKTTAQEPEDYFRAVERWDMVKGKPGDKAGWVHGGYARARAFAPAKLRERAIFRTTLAKRYCPRRG